MSKDEQAPSNALHSFQATPVPSGNFMNWTVSLFARVSDRKCDHIGTLLLVEKDADKVDAISGEVCEALDRLFKANRQ